MNNEIKLPSQIIKEKLIKNNGNDFCNMLKGDPIRIHLTEKGVIFESFPTLICEWQIIDSIYEKCKELGGIMYRGDSAAHNGFKIGSSELPIDTIDGYISLKFYGNSIGNSTLRRSTYYSALLAWAGLVYNRRSNGKGGYIEIR